MQKYKSIDLKLKHKKHDLHTWLLILCDQKKGKHLSAQKWFPLRTIYLWEDWNATCSISFCLGLSLRLREVVAVREIFFFGSLTIWSVFQKVDASFD